MDASFLLYPPLFLALYLITKHFLHKIQNHPPSPFLSLPVLGHLYLLKKPLYRSLAKVSQKCGPIVLLQFGSRQVLVVSSPDGAEECFNKNDIVFANRPRLLAGKILGQEYTSLSWTPYGENLRTLRKISALEILSAHKLQLLHGIRVDEVNLMLKKLKKDCKDGSPVPMKMVFFEMLFNVMMRMIAGKRYYGDNVEDLEEAMRFRNIVLETFKIMGATNVGDFLPVLSRLGIGGLEKKLTNLQSKRNGFMQELLDECRRRRGTGADPKAEGKKQSMFEMMLSLQDSEPEYYTDDKIKSLMLVLLAAGTDTTVGTLEWAMTSLLNYPEVLKKAQAEIDANVGHERLIDESDLGNLPYLRCVLNETMRMFPTGPLLLPHESSEECTVGGYRVPAGTMLLVNVWSIHNDPKNWDEPRKFMPERFEGLEGSRVGFKLMPFGFGRRGCPGENLAMRVMGFALGSVLQCFDCSRVGKELVDISEGYGVTLPKAEPLMAKCKPRPEAAKLLAQL